MDVPARISLAFLVLGAAGAWWLNRQLDGQAPTGVERPARAGYYMTEAELTRPGPDGLPEYRLLADSVRQEVVNGPTELTDVRVEYGVYTATPWLLTAPRGRVSADQSTLELEGGVVVAGDVEGDQDTRMETERLSVDVRTHVATTAAPVRFAIGGDWLSATGMTAYLMEERLRLQSSVHGQFQP